MKNIVIFIVFALILIWSFNAWDSENVSDSRSFTVSEVQKKDQNLIETKGLSEVPKVVEAKEAGINERKNIYAAELKEEFIQSIFTEIEAFNMNEYLKKSQYRKEYLAGVVPARANRSAKLGSNVRGLSSVTSSYVSVEKGESVQLKVKAMPNMPVSFTTLDGGHFDNNEKAITVEAGATGEATVVFNSGASQRFMKTTILCSSAVCLGREEFLIETKAQKK